MSLKFYKMTGAGNDFVAINNLEDILPTDVEQRAQLIRQLCHRRFGVGADGTLFIEPSSTAHFRMRYYNSDGSEATCGNGARCIARFAYLLGIAPERMRFETIAGPYEAIIKPDTVTISMSDAHDLRMGVPVEIPGLFSGTVDFVNTGVPHAMVRVPDIEKAPVVELGRAIRFHEAFAPQGTNVNFVCPTSTPNHLLIRTYERGVEDETLACGTGNVASAILTNRLGLTTPPVRLTTRSGTDLLVSFEPTDNGARQVRLEGEARVVFTGQWD
ncbi:MAG TPA: diaminopimelate epimerase [Candidatus Sumerlaeota bacterium]|nr:diaminopimelate epimerase [Candidatus Sumerlaeota bacterium]HPS02049.1 diaminopimelate epimerase [Candidatus Sumerlaeota bacterium]